MDKYVLIHVCGLQMLEDSIEQEPIEMVVPGRYYFRNGSHFLRYEERQEDFTEPTVNLIRITSTEVAVHKQGLINVDMNLQQGKKNFALYKTPMGTVRLGIEATDLSLSVREEEIRVKVEYALDMNEEHVADCRLSFEVWPRGSREFSL